jgi:hypothetical protein
MRKVEHVGEDLTEIGNWVAELHADLEPGTAKSWIAVDARPLAEDGITRLPLPPLAHCEACGGRMFRRPDRQLAPVLSTSVTLAPGYWRPPRELWGETEPRWVPPLLAAVEHPDGPALYGDLVYGDKTYCPHCDARSQPIGETRAPVRTAVEHVLETMVIGRPSSLDEDGDLQPARLGRLLQMEAHVRQVLGDSPPRYRTLTRPLRRHAQASHVRQVTLVKGEHEDPEYIASGWRFIERGDRVHGDPDGQAAVDAARYLSRQLVRIDRYPDLFAEVDQAAHEIKMAILVAVGAGERRQYLRATPCPICEMVTLAALLDHGKVVCLANRLSRGDEPPIVACECGREDCPCHRGRRHEWERCTNRSHPGDCCCGWERFGDILGVRESA